MLLYSSRLFPQLQDPHIWTRFAWTQNLQGRSLSFHLALLFLASFLVKPHYCQCYLITIRIHCRSLNMSWFSLVLIQVFCSVSLTLLSYCSLVQSKDSDRVELLQDGVLASVRIFLMTIHRSLREGVEGCNFPWAVEDRSLQGNLQEVDRLLVTVQEVVDMEYLEPKGKWNSLSLWLLEVTCFVSCLFWVNGSLGLQAMHKTKDLSHHCWHTHLSAFITEPPYLCQSQLVGVCQQSIFKVDFKPSLAITHKNLEAEHSLLDQLACSMV